MVVLLHDVPVLAAPLVDVVRHGPSGALWHPSDGAQDRAQWAGCTTAAPDGPSASAPCPDGFDFWPVAEVESFGFLPLSGELRPTEAGWAVMRIAGCNDIDPDGDRLPRETVR